MNNKLPEWRKTLNKSVENYQSMRAWYEENRDSPAALDDMERAEDQLANFVRKCGFSIVLSLLDEIDELQELHRSCLALRGEIEDVQEQLYEAENRNNADDEELQERRKADSAEPAGYHVIKECGKVGCSVATLEEAEKTRDFWNKKWIIRPYFYTPPASERERIRREHAEWSDATFGDVGPIGPLKHLSKEALEAAADPSDPLEWADMQFLLWDAQRRMGISDEFITRAMIEKLAVNKQREWPEPKDGEPRLHIKEQPAPVVPDGLRQALSNAGIAAPESDEMLAATCEKYIQMLVTWVKDRKPFQPAPVVPDDGRAEFEAWMLKKWGRERQEYDFTMGKFLHGENYADSYTRHMWKAWTESRAAMLQSKYRDLSQPVDPQISEYEKIMLQAGNSPVIPDGYVLVPVEPTDEMIAAAMECDDVVFDSKDPTAFCVQFREIYCAMVAAAPKQENV